MTKDVVHFSRCNMVPTASSLAWQLGYLQDAAGALHDTDVELTLGDFDHGDDRYWLRHAGTSKPAWARARGADTRVVALSWHASAQSIYALPDSGIASAADLTGRRIAMVRGVRAGDGFDVERSVFMRPYYTALLSAGLELKDVAVVETEMIRELVHGPASASGYFADVARLFLRQLLRGEVDAIATGLPPEVIRFFDLRKSYDARDDPNPDARRDLRGLTVSAATLAQHRDAVVRLVARLMDASAWAGANEQEAITLLARDLNLDEAAFRARGTDVRRLTEVDLTPEQLSALEAKKRFLAATGDIENDFAIADWVDPTIVRDARALRAAAAPS